MGLNKKCYVYRFIDKQNRYMYVGETNNLSRRIGQHLNLKSGKFNKKLLKNIKKIEYIKVNDKIEARQFEIYYINRLHPYLNKADKFNNVLSHRNDFYERKWLTYKVYKNDDKTSPVHNRIALVAMYVAFVCIIIFTLNNML